MCSGSIVLRSLRETRHHVRTEWPHPPCLAGHSMDPVQPNIVSPRKLELEQESRQYVPDMWTRKTCSAGVGSVWYRLKQNKMCVCIENAIYVYILYMWHCAYIYIYGSYICVCVCTYVWHIRHRRTETELTLKLDTWDQIWILFVFVLIHLWDLR